jgi:hypothetical protein
MHAITLYSATIVEVYTTYHHCVSHMSCEAPAQTVGTLWSVKHSNTQQTYTAVMSYYITYAQTLHTLKPVCYAPRLQQPLTCSMLSTAVTTDQTLVQHEQLHLGCSVVARDH